MSIICANINHSIQVHIPARRSSTSFIFKMKCEVTSSTTHNVLISKEVRVKSYKEICSGEKKKVNLGHWGNWGGFIVKNNSIVHLPKPRGHYIHGSFSTMAYEWEIFSTFFSTHNIEQNWLFYNYTYGFTLGNGSFSGCIGKV